jgi:hypothetical protein
VDDRGSCAIGRHGAHEPAERVVHRLCTVGGWRARAGPRHARRSAEHVVRDVVHRPSPIEGAVPLLESPAELVRCRRRRGTVSARVFDGHSCVDADDGLERLVRSVDLHRAGGHRGTNSAECVVLEFVNQAVRVLRDRRDTEGRMEDLRVPVACGIVGLLDEESFVVIEQVLDAVGLASLHLLRRLRDQTPHVVLELDLLPPRVGRVREDRAWLPRDSIQSTCGIVVPIDRACWWYCVVGIPDHVRGRIELADEPRCAVVQVMGSPRRRHSTDRFGLCIIGVAPRVVGNGSTPLPLDGLQSRDGDTRWRDAHGRFGLYGRPPR